MCAKYKIEKIMSGEYFLYEDVSKWYNPFNKWKLISRSYDLDLLKTRMLDGKETEVCERSYFDNIGEEIIYW